MTRLLLFILVCSYVVDLTSQSTAQEVLEKSIKYHDPKGILSKGHLTLQLLGTRPNGPDQMSTVYLHQNEEEVKISSSRDEQEILMHKLGSQSSFTIDGRKDLTEEEVKKYRLTDQRLQLMANYYRYLWLAPLVLEDPGTHLGNQVNETEFFGKKALEVKVTYDPEVGADIWYFYFDPATYAMIGYRFYHDEAANDGEYILLSEEVIYEKEKIVSSLSLSTK